MNDALNPARKNKQRIRIKRKSEFDKGGGKYRKVYPKLYTGDKGKITATFYEVDVNGKKLIHDPSKWLGVPFTGKNLIQDPQYILWEKLRLLHYSQKKY